MTTRDSKAWPLVAIGAVLTAIAAQPELIEGVMERRPKSIASLLCIVLAAVAGVMVASPLPISDEGRAKYEQDKVRLK